MGFDFVNLASNKTQKGHLTKQERGADDNQTIEGVLKYVIIDRIDSDGWMVEVGSGTDTFIYPCSNPEPFLTLPDSTKTDTMYVPKNKTRVEISIDKQTNIYTIMRVIGSVSVFSNYQDTLKISINQNEKTNQDVNAEIELTNDSIKLGANNIIINDINLMEAQETQSNQIKILVDENTILKERINNIEAQLNQEESQEESEEEGGG